MILSKDVSDNGETIDHSQKKKIKPDPFQTQLPNELEENRSPDMQKEI